MPQPSEFGTRDLDARRDLPGATMGLKELPLIEALRSGSAPERDGDAPPDGLHDLLALPQGFPGLGLQLRDALLQF
jgi:hypothetical protein